MHFYQVIIGSEILNRRRVDKHFDFLSAALLARGEKLHASFTIADDTALIRNVFTLVKNDPESIMFSFGGIGSTPDDLTRKIAAEVFTGEALVCHEEAKKLIINQFGKEAYPHRIRMADLPKNAKLLDNVINNVPGFYLQDRFFFTPGFPEMSHPMIEQAFSKVLKNRSGIYRKTLTALCSENVLIELMRQIPKSIEFSSLPKFCPKRLITIISLSSKEHKDVDYWYNRFISYMQDHDIKWVEGDKHDDHALCI